MIRIFTIAAVLVCLANRGGFADDAAPIRVMSFNIRYGSARDGENSWEKRREFVVDTIKAFNPDLLGTQETLGFQRDYLAENLPGYAVLGVGRDDGREQGEMMAIYIRKERFDLVKSGHFWLSETPDKVGSKGWDTSLPRMATWAELRDKLAPHAPPLVWMNTHFDHIGVEARKQAAVLLRRRAEEHQDKAVLVTGDFNSGVRSDAYRNLFGPMNGTDSPLLDTFRAIPGDKQQFDDAGTFSGFKGGGARKGGRIDWIGVTRQLEVQSAGIDYTERDGRTPSDHFPITAVLGWKR